MNYNNAQNQQTPQQLRILQLTQQAFREQAQLQQQAPQQVIQHQASFPPHHGYEHQQQQQSIGKQREALQRPQQVVKPMPSVSNLRSEKPYIKIIEQPTNKPMRFRYECEGRFAGAILGRNSTPEQKTFPAIEIVGFKGRAVVVVSCVTTDPPYRPHPYNLVGKSGCKKGVYSMEINKSTMRVDFSNLGIQCVKKKEVIDSLKVREEIRVDPFKTGFDHRNKMTNTDFNTVRLCFQVFIENARSGRVVEPITPVVSDPIRNKCTVSELAIVELCGCSTTVLGNTQIMLKCEKVAKDDIAVRFFEENNGEIVWEGYGDFQPIDVHKSIGITLKTPRYYRLDITEPVTVCVQLMRPSDSATSEAINFTYNSIDLDMKRKRQRHFDDSMYLLLKQHQLEINQNQIKSEIPAPAASPQVIQNVFPSPSSVAGASPIQNSPHLANEIANENYYETPRNQFTELTPQINSNVDNQNWNKNPMAWNAPAILFQHEQQHHADFQNLEHNQQSASTNPLPNNDNTSQFNPRNGFTNVLNEAYKAYNQILNIDAETQNDMDLCTENLRISDLLISS